MPREDRQIIFSFEETYKALYALCVQKEIKRPPPGAIMDIKPLPDDDSQLKFKIDNMQDSSQHMAEYGRDFLAAALMLYCRSLGIPISKRARKSVELKSEEVVLRLKI
jgi:hypothetical protein